MLMLLGAILLKVPATTNYCYQLFSSPPLSTLLLKLPVSILSVVPVSHPSPISLYPCALFLDLPSPLSVFAASSAALLLHHLSHPSACLMNPDSPSSGVKYQTPLP
ncbi:hypothetical protein EJ05DRAFT_78914 [Pseudovirgaria hyperparasitica]|uniref:Uncharacterized protein n=1 Tax=Pseudovirgaria hyperparasitica TaxID=470096 RepID=A0A6A6VYS5_9PEZI|nr:uncharacterized protein EJ05DRAFT_78914 [Pseudovirgaria hyperparasitica]KAF2755818.1 hypothetical protein EJ05DRAFT_78914 [Pseudovirgaria hyperparasitica]